VEDLEQELGLAYRMMGRKGLASIENVGPQMARVVEALIGEHSSSANRTQPESRLEIDQLFR
jgi:hypothetical protein